MKRVVTMRPIPASAIRRSTTPRASAARCAPSMTSPSGRLLTGHSSGGWAALWLQVTYPKLFGGTWPTSPDPSDFRDFLGIDLYAPNANVYRKPDGTPWPLA